MAVDEAIGHHVAEGLSQATLRFYAWDPPCVSLGRNQRSSSIDRSRCQELGYDVVRRPTGGRAILHIDELTYSLVARPDHPIMLGSVLVAYERIAAALIAGLHLLGVRAERAPGESRTGPHASAACFDLSSAYEIVTDGRKLLGSAQLRRPGYVLQHGSLPLTGDLGRVADCLAAEGEDVRKSLTDHAATLEQAASRTITFAEAARALADGMARSFGCSLTNGELTESEIVLAGELRAAHYDTASWTLRR
jgi:lipoate-protein ligase A